MEPSRKRNGDFRPRRKAIWFCSDCHESRSTGSLAPLLGPQSPSPSNGLAWSPRPQLRSFSAPRRLARSYRSGSNIPHTRPLASLGPSPCCYLGMLARPFSCHHYVCYFPLVMLARPFSVPYCLRVFASVAMSRVLAARRPSAMMCFPWAQRSSHDGRQRNCVSLAGKL